MRKPNSSHVARKPVFGVSRQVFLATHFIQAIVMRKPVLVSQTTKMLIRLHDVKASLHICCSKPKHNEPHHEKSCF